jgi:opine dehydrogenase
MIKNANRILNQENFNFYIDGISPEYAIYMEEMDKERYAVAKAVGLEPRTVTEWLNVAYGVPKGSLYEMIQKTPPYINTPENSNRSPAPRTLYHRYLLEEIPLRAVPTVEIAKIFGIPTPKYDEMINSACELTGVDFWKTGRTLDDMGLTKQDVLDWKNTYCKRRYSK